MTESIVESSAETVSNVAKTEKIRVLHVDDDLAFLKIAKQCLELQGEIDVDTASSVNEALRKLKEMDYDVIVSDYQMPGKDGLEFLKELREQGNTVPFIVFTGRGREEIVLKALNLGADRYVDKHDGPEAVYCELAQGISEVAEKKRIKDALGSSQAKYKSLVQNIPGMVYRARPDWSTEIIANSKSVCGYTIQEFDSRRVNWLDMIHPDDKARVAKEAGIILEGPASITQEYRIADKEGGVRWVEDHKTSFFSKNGVFEGIDGVVFDVTSRKKTEQALHASLDRYRSFIEVTGQLGWTTNADGEVVEDTPSFRKFTGQTYEEAKGRGWSKALHPDDLERTTKIWKEATRTKSKYETEFRLRRHDGVYRYFIARGVPVLGEDGSIGEWVGTCIDITTLKDVEEHLKEMNKKLEATNEKLHVVGGLTRHDVRNKLAAVAGNAYLARKKLPENSEVLDYMKRIEASVKQTVQIFDFARAYEMLGVEELVHVDVEKSVNEAISLFSGLKDIKVINDCHGLTVLADSLLRQLFYNLIDNSLKHGEKLNWIRVYYEDKNDHLNLTYEDDGVGVPQAAKPKLFGEGYTTGKGSGYGLFLVKRMMEVYGWTIQETSEPGKGAQFTITIPRTNKDEKENYRLS